MGKIVAKLPKDQTRQLTGTMRGYERDKLIDDPIFKRFLPKPETGDATVYLVCTSAGEVGVNISADHLVCDLSTFDSMAQRFGRVNRFGLCDDTRIDIIHPNKFDEKDKLSPPRTRTLALLLSLDGNGSPASLGSLDAVARVEAFAPTPTILPTSDILFDAWSLTSIRDRMPGRPKVEPFLHGITEWEPPRTKIAWRTDVSEIISDLLLEHPPEELLEIYPLKPHELLTDRSDRIFNTLKKLSPDSDFPVWIIDDDEKVEVSTLAQIVADDKDAIDGKTLLLPPQVGGLESGFFTPTAKFDPTTRYDVADEWADKSGPMRHREWATGDDDQVIPGGMKSVRKIVFTAPGADEDADPTKTWHWFVRISATEADARSRTSYDLQRHLDDAKEAATRFVASLALEPELRDAVILACAVPRPGQGSRTLATRHRQ